MEERTLDLKFDRAEGHGLRGLGLRLGLFLRGKAECQMIWGQMAIWMGFWGYDL